MKSFFKNKKVIIIVAIILLVAVIGGSCFVLLRPKDNGSPSNDKVFKEEEYVAYVKINPLVKLTFKSSFYECEDEDGKVNLCEKFTNEIIKAEFLNDDAKNIYDNLDFKGKSLTDAIVLIAKTAENKGYDITNVQINTNWNYIDHIEKDITNELKKESNIEVEIKFNYQKTLDEAALLEKEQNKNYTVNFDSDGGTNVASQTITANNKVTKPEVPTKDGYTFVEWQLDNQTYDFNSIVEKDITLKAKWSEQTTPNNNSNTANNKPSNNQSNGTNNNQNQMSQKEKDNEILKKQLKEKGLTWDTSSKEEAYRIYDKWATGGYGGEVIESSYGSSDIAYTVKITLNTAGCHGNEILNIDWRNSEPIDFVYYLHSKGYNCSGNVGYYNGKSFHIDDNNELIWD